MSISNFRRSILTFSSLIDYLVEVSATIIFCDFRQRRKIPSYFTNYLFLRLEYVHVVEVWREEVAGYPDLYPSIQQYSGSTVQLQEKQGNYEVLVVENKVTIRSLWMKNKVNIRSLWYKKKVTMRSLLKKNKVTIKPLWYKNMELWSLCGRKQGNNQVLVVNNKVTESERSLW